MTGLGRAAVKATCHSQLIRGGPLFPERNASGQAPSTTVLEPGAPPMLPLGQLARTLESSLTSQAARQQAMQMRTEAAGSARGGWRARAGPAFGHKVQGRAGTRSPPTHTQTEKRPLRFPRLGKPSLLLDTKFRGERGRSPPPTEIMQSRFPHLGNSQRSAKPACND